MPFKIGLSEKRKERLDKELNRIIPEMKKMGVEKIILFGSMSEGKIHKRSDIDIIIIKKSSKRFLDRLDEFYKKIKPRCAIDFIVYTPEELNKLKLKNSFIRQALKKGKILYETR